MKLSLPLRCSPRRVAGDLGSDASHRIGHCATAVKVEAEAGCETTHKKIDNGTASGLAWYGMVWLGVAIT